jgi:hypothetical protein
MPLVKPHAIKKADETVEDLTKGLKVASGKSLADVIKRWRQSAPEEKDGSREFTKIEVERDISLRIEIRYDAISKGWTVIYEFTVPSLFSDP